MTDKELYDLCHEYLEYRDGKLYWKKVMSNRAKIGQEAGYPEKTGYIQIGIRGSLYRTHRLVFLMHHGYLPKFIDHVNRDKTDNRVENIRECSPSQNSANQPLSQNSRSGYKGVYFNKDKGKYHSRLCRNGKAKHLGYFTTPEEAHKAYVKAAKKYFGEFACTG